jgi:hypothetical protein
VLHAGARSVALPASCISLRPVSRMPHMRSVLLDACVPIINAFAVDTAHAMSRPPFSLCVHRWAGGKQLADARGACIPIPPLLSRPSPPGAGRPMTRWACGVLRGKSVKSHMCTTTAVRRVTSQRLATTCFPYTSRLGWQKDEGDAHAETAWQCTIAVRCSARGSDHQVKAGHGLA